VRIADRAGERDVMAERVILAAGTIASPMLLMRSGIGSADELRALGIAVHNDLPGVGRNLHDHLLSGGNVYRARRPVPPSKYQNSESLMYLARDGASCAPELVLACVIAPVTTECFAPLTLGEAYTIMFGFTHPRSRGTLTLASADPGAAPLIDPQLSGRGLRPRDLSRGAGTGARGRRRKRAVRLAPGGISARSIRADHGGETCVPGAGGLHASSSGRHLPHGRDEEAVVGTDLAVRGFDNLFVCDASIMPAITTGPVNAAIVAIAERFSDLLRGRAALAPYLPAGAPVVQFPWKFICYDGKEAADGRKEELERLYPARKLIPFAYESGTDDCSCFDAATPSSNPRVYFVHAYASPGWEDRGYANDFSDWLNIAEEAAAAWRQWFQNKSGRDALEARLEKIRREKWR
jgi:choline dehydrogenase-like flavoprotein